MEAQAAKKVIEFPAKADEGFDIRTHIRDAKTGRLHILQPFAYHAQGDLRLHERPIGSGNMFSPNGDPIGRWTLKGEGKNRLWEKISEQHTEVAPNIPVNREEHLENELTASQKEVAALKAEREALLAEKMKAQGEKKQAEAKTGEQMKQPQTQNTVQNR